MTDLTTYRAQHFLDDTSRSGLESLDAAIEWALDVVKNFSGAPEDNTVSIYPHSQPGGVDRIAAVYPDMVVVNDGHGTNNWPSGWNYLEDTNA